MKNILGPLKLTFAPLIILGATFAFEIYDLEGQSRLDLFYLGDILRSLKLNPTLKMVEKFGGTEKKGEKFVNFDQFCKVSISQPVFIWQMI